MVRARFGAWLTIVALTFPFCTPVSAETIGTAGADDVVIFSGGKSSAIVVVSSQAGEWEKKGASDLVRYLRQMSNGEVKLADTPAAAAQAMEGQDPLLVVGQAALDADPSLKTALTKVAKANPVLRADAIVLKRDKNRVLLAGTNDDSHYYAVAELLRRCGCRWYLPGEFGESIPHHAELKIGSIDFAYAPPFEVRKYWLSWNGDDTGKAEFMRRNFMNDIGVPNGHNLAQYTKDLIPPGKTMFNVPISEQRTAEHVAKQVLPLFAKGQDVQLGLEDGIYESESPQDKALIALQYDKHFLTQSYTDAFMMFYNNVADLLLKAHPQSRSRIGFLIYSNITLPPVKDIKAAKPLVGYLAPIDYDPIHPMADPRSGPRREYREVLGKWAKVMDGRLVIYDYDQSMLVWRDLPNPSHMAFAKDVKEYQKVGVLGVDTESRGATATTFLNLFFRGQLLWNPDTDVQAELTAFYAKFYGPAAAPMCAYWSDIYQAWEQTLVTEHEYFVASAIYTPELIARLRKDLEGAEAALKQRKDGPPTEDAKTYAERLRFTRLSSTLR